MMCVRNGVQIIYLLQSNGVWQSMPADGSQKAALNVKAANSVSMLTEKHLMPLYSIAALTG